MTKRLLAPPENKPTKDQKRVIDEYFKGCGRVCVSAGAGTGKTFVLVETYAQIVEQNLLNEPNNNPFKNILAVTFTVEAARKLKNDIRKRVQESRLKNERRNRLLAWLETDSWIMTLDKLSRTLLKEVATDIGIPPEIKIPDEYEIHNLLEEIIKEIKDDTKLASEARFLQNILPVESWRNKEGWKGIIFELLEYSRQHCLRTDELEEIMLESFYKILYQGYRPKFKSKQINKILRDVCSGETPPDNTERVDNSFNYNEEILKAILSVYKRVESEYEKLCIKNGWLDHNDIRYYLIIYARGKLSDSSGDWLSMISKRFSHILVDEFQDTSFAQCEMLRYLISKHTKSMFIGDPKQAIYQWRNAEPWIFSEMIFDSEEIDDINSPINPKKPKNKIRHINAEGFRTLPLVSNFRSTKCLVRLFNNFFGENEDSIFADDSRFVKCGPLPHKDLVPESPMPKKKPPSPSIHLFDDVFAQQYAMIARTISEITQENSNLCVRDRENGKPIWRPALPGDCAILLQTRTPWTGGMRRELIRYHVKYVMIGEKGFYQRPEISLVIELLDWLGNPHRKDPLIKILMSPLIGISHKGMRYLASYDFNLEKAIKSPPDWFFDESKRIEGLIEVRDDLRWRREDRKARMIELIIKYSHLDSLLLCLRDGEQALANLWMLQEIVQDLEEEELISYPELVDRLKFLREGSDATLAPISDEEDKESVKVLTVHSAKGLEYPIVFIPKPELNLGLSWESHAGNKVLFIMKHERCTSDQKLLILLQQKAPGSFNPEDWEELLSPPKTRGELNNLIGGSTPNLLFNPLVYDWWSEKFRLLYVGMTRSTDHLFLIDRGSSSLSWQNAISDKIEKLRGSDFLSDPNCCEDYEMPTPEILRNEPGTLKFDDKFYIYMKKNLSIFTPRSLNPSHIHDILFCPRRYQYAVLQQVRGGEYCTVPSRKIVDIQFGAHLHRALELDNFSNHDISDEANLYLSELNNDEKKNILKAVKSFRKSKIFSDFDLSSSDQFKEFEIVYSTMIGKKNVFIKSKIDLLILDNRRAHIFDYKTIYPKGKSVYDKFYIQHYEKQLLMYCWAVERGLGKKVKKAGLLIYEPNKWIVKYLEDPTKWKQLEKDLKSLIPLKVVERGLEAKPKNSLFCKKCEFKLLCQKS